MHAPKAQEVQKTQKAQKRNQAKVQNATSKHKIKNALKNIEGGKSHLFGYWRFCAFCAREEKEIEHRKQKREKKRKVPTMQCKCTGFNKSS